jgi:pimeloyl-ACP methyl ester carboxylesterase
LHDVGDSKLDPAQYSYVHAALDAGYTVLNYDRLGCGLSSKADAYTVVQGPIEIELLQVLTQKVREGTLLSTLTAGYTYPPTLKLPPFEKIVHVGHSLGSQITAALLKKYGNQFSGAILTGFIYTIRPNPLQMSALELQYAATNNPALR